MKKKPDKFKTKKIPLKQIVKRDSYLTPITDVIERSNEIIIHTYQFLRLWLLDKYSKKEQIPIMTESTIKMVFKTLTDTNNKTKGPKIKGDNKIIYDEFINFYNNQYCKLLNKKQSEEKFNGNHLSSILDYQCTEMITSIENNIKLNFMKYIKRFIWASFKDKNDIILDKLEGKEKTKMRKQLKNELMVLYNDFINDTSESDQKYHLWIKENKSNILPNEYINSYEHDISINPYKYLKYMIYICIELEKMNIKSYQFFPLRKDTKIKYVTIDSKTLIMLFMKNQNEYLSNILDYRKSIWTRFFKLKHKIFKLNNYSFDYIIMTDGLVASIRFLNNNNYDEMVNKKKAMSKMKNKIKKETELMSFEEKIEYRNKIKDKNKLLLDKKKLEKREQTKIQR